MQRAGAGWAYYLVHVPSLTMPTSRARSTKPAPVKTKRTWLSATSLESLRRCPRCFWLRFNQGIYQPEGIVSRLANRFDGVIKKYFDLYRASGELPPFLAAQVTGSLQDPFKETYFVELDEQFGYMGKLDECLIERDGKATPVDHKTSSADPRQKETLPAYQFQLDSYAYLLEQNGLPTSGRGHLIYYYPDHSRTLHHGVPMVIHIVTLKTDPSRVEPRARDAIRIMQGTQPEPSADCPFCAWYEKVKRVV